eukprot:750962-Karenia_brevis.AAC.1
MQAIFLPAAVLLVDEYSMLSGRLNHALCLRGTYARESAYKLKREDYAMPKERCGRMPIVAYAGDRLQLPPVPQTEGLFTSPVGKSQEHKVGTAIFRNCECVFRMTTMMRFKCEALKRILAAMRTPKGAAIAEADWLERKSRDIVNLQKTSLFQYSECQDYFHTCYCWNVTSMMMFMLARCSARQHQKTLYYVQAVDTIKTMVAGMTPAHQREVYAELLRLSSMQKTERLPSYCLLHQNMKVRLTITLHPQAVQDATGTVVDFQWRESDERISAAKPGD